MNLKEAMKIAVDSINNGFTQEDIDSRGRFEVVCIGNRGCEDCLTNGKTYEVSIGGCILPSSPIAELIGDNNEQVYCHLHRFVKIKRLQ